MAKRAVAQSAAREFGPQGIHVAHIVVDGVVDNPNTRKYFAEKVLYDFHLKILTQTICV